MAYVVYCPLDVVFLFDQVDTNGIYAAENKPLAETWLRVIHCSRCSFPSYRHQIYPVYDPFEMNGA